ncbi:hypothetical protein DPMN_025084 [Dreissena polymorpha]|uniref:Uncharacterized protein n=1 Tax=Dreissena polymorpha TaxID=45954 RepID=A0A9D4LSM0_DREPO|nr:hypothetical protein DPMN_025084 [Dreissena polymorpha]
MQSTKTPTRNDKRAYKMTIGVRTRLIALSVIIKQSLQWQSTLYLKFDYARKAFETIWSLLHH